jgi:hypothetical protein
MAYDLNVMGVLKANLVTATVDVVIASDCAEDFDVVSVYLQG